MRKKFSRVLTLLFVFCLASVMFIACDTAPVDQPPAGGEPASGGIVADQPAAEEEIKEPEQPGGENEQGDEGGQGGEGEQGGTGDNGGTAKVDVVLTTADIAGTTWVDLANKRNLVFSNAQSKSYTVNQIAVNADQTYTVKTAKFTGTWDINADGHLVLTHQTPASAYMAGKAYVFTYIDNVLSTTNEPGYNTYAFVKE